MTGVSGSVFSADRTSRKLFFHKRTLFQSFQSSSTVASTQGIMSSQNIVSQLPTYIEFEYDIKDNGKTGIS